METAAIKALREYNEEMKDEMRDEGDFSYRTKSGKRGVNAAIHEYTKLVDAVLTELREAVVIPIGRDSTSATGQ